MSTLQQIRNNFNIIVAQTDTSNADLTAAQIDGLINQAIRYFATKIKYPRDITYVQVEEGANIYTVPSDFILLNNAWFGQRSLLDDVKPLDITTTEGLNYIDPQWLDSNSSKRGRPERIILLDRNSFLIHPTPDAEHAAIGKELIIEYVYSPSPLTDDGDEPDLPLSYHDHIHLFAAHLAYLGPLKNKELSEGLFRESTAKLKELEPIVTKETQRSGWMFSPEDSGDLGGGSSGNVGDLTL